MGEVCKDGDLLWYVDEDYPASKEVIREYESQVIWLCILIGSKEKTFVDVGACTGKYVIPMSKHYGKVIAIEPNPAKLGYLKKNIELNGCDNVEILEFAVANFSGVTKLSLNGAQSKIGEFDDDGGVYVPVGTLDELVSEADIVKIDVGGAEKQVVEGSKQLIEVSKPIFVIEHNEYKSGNEPKEHLDIMKKIVKKGYLPFNFNHVHWVYLPREYVEAEEYDFAGGLSEMVLGKLIGNHIFYEVLLKNIKEGSLLEFVAFLTYHAPHEEEWLKICRETLINNYDVRI